jgi:ribose transport system ATP-binding protein
LSSLSGDDLHRLITGSAVKTSRPQAAAEKSASGKAVLEVKDVSSQRLTNINLTVHRGEVLGVTGLIGSGRSELGRIVYDLQTRTTGEVRVNGEPIELALASRGIGYIPQDRRAGLFPGLSVEENITITAAERLNRWFGLSPKRVRDAAMQVIRSFQIRPADPVASLGILSGGNQQKVALGKWMQLPLELIILDEPTQAIDIGTKQDLMTTIKERARAEGLAVLWLESDIEEIVKYADRIIVMNTGRISAEFSEPPFSLQEVLAEAYRMNDEPAETKGGDAHAARIEHGR